MFDHNLKRLLEIVQLTVKGSKGRRVTKTIGMFDLSGSTPLKLQMGHTSGTRAALTHNLVCREIVRRSGGRVVKELGDGVLVQFDDPVKACLAATSIKTVTQKIENCLTKAGLTIGSVEEITIGGIVDILGATVDRCARLQASASPGQILVDTALHDVVASFLKDCQNICFSQPKTMMLRGVGEIDVYELSTKERGFVGWQRMSFNLHEEGRLDIKEKVAFMQGADCEVIELGTGLTTFADYFKSRRPAEFKNHVIELLRHGVTFKCLALDPDSPIVDIYAEDRKEENLKQEIHNSLEELQTQRDEFASLSLEGSFEVYVYDHFPYFHAVCVDPMSENGRMTVSHYIGGLARADTPVMQFSRSSNPLMFGKYWSSVEKLMDDAKKL